MRYAGSLEKALLPAFVLLWLVCFGLSLHSSLEETGYPSVILSASHEPDGYPVLVGFGPVPGVEAAGLRIGDRLRQIADTDLRGKGHIALYAPFARAGREQREIAVRFDREGAIEDASLPVGSYRVYWPRLPASLVFALAALLLHLRASATTMGRAFAQTFMCAALFLACTFGGSDPVTFFAIAVHLVSVALVVPLALRAALLFPHGNPPRSFLARTGPWVFVLLGLFDGSRFYEFVFSRQVGVVAMTIGDLAFFLLVLGIATHTYRRSDPVGRRQIKWVLLGVYLAIAFPIATVILVAMDLDFISVMVTSMATLGFIPISLVIAIARYNLFDIDRLISATASYTILAVVVVAGFLSGVPAATRAIAGPIGIEAGTTQVVLSLLLATVLVPCHRLMSPRIERVIYPERHALAQGIERLLEQLVACQDPRELVRLAGECLDALLRPESCAIYARDEYTFSPIFVRGRVVPPAFEASSPLISVLEKRAMPLSAEGLSQRRRRVDLSPFDRAALETLGVPVVLPVRRTEILVAFICLGSKRSGDVYTSTDLALLAAVADRLSAELQRFDQAELIREARAMQETLRRYVPGALAEELARGRDLEVGQREVSVLFVDIRGYASFAEDRSAGEIFSTVNQYTQRVTQIIRSHGGSVVEFNGDGMMAVFGAPHALARKERAAAEAGREIVDAVASLAVKGGARLEVGVGVATGNAFVGNIQAADRMIWTAIGNTTNLAARLQGMTRVLDAAMLVDATTWSRAGAAVSGFDALPATPIEGRRKAEDLYALPRRRAAVANQGAAGAAGVSTRTDH